MQEKRRTGMQKSAIGSCLIIIALFGFHAVTTGDAVGSGVVELTTQNYTVRFTDGQGAIIINQRPTLQIGSVTLEWTSQYFKGVSIRKTGSNTATVKYKTYNESPLTSVLTAKYTCLPREIKIHLDLNVPSGVDPGGAMFEVSPLKGTAKKELFKGGLWTRNEDGGESYEVKDGYFRHFTDPKKKVMLKILGNANWDGPDYQHIPFVKVEGTASRYTSDVQIFVVPNELSLAGAAATAAGRTAVVELSTTKAFNLFKPGDGVPVFTAKVGNAQSKTLAGELTVVARTLDNKIAVNQKRSISLKGLAASKFTFKLPAAERELFFVDASFRANGKEYFSRTNVAILPDFEFKHKSKSVFGISDYFKVPDNTSALTLLQRLGVHHLRDGDNGLVADYGILSFAAMGIQPENEITSAELASRLGVCIDRGNPVVEFGNEWNLLDDKWGNATIYCDWAKTLFAVRGSMPIKIITQGIAGWDEEYLNYLMGDDCCSSFEGIAFHPGRANFTADADDDDLAEVEGGNWNYYGTVENYMASTRAHCDLPCYATEVYAGTFPNVYYRDSYRQAGSNIVLSLALGLAEGLSSIMVYQLNDGTWYDVGGVNHEDQEYHFGLLMRDASLKPSAMAYAATAEILDGAKFVKYLNNHTSTLRALVFDTDNGKVTILWDRREGYIQAEGQSGFFHPEPWVPAYTKKGKYSFPTSKDAVVVVDIIGRKHMVQAVDGVVTLTLTGEPIFVYDIGL